MWKRCPKKTLDAFIHFHTLLYALEGFTCFHMLLYAFISFYMLSYAFISFPTFSYTLLDVFSCFYTLFICFPTHSNAKKQNVPSSPLPPSSTYTNVWLSRCAAGKNSYSERFDLWLLPWIQISQSRSVLDPGLSGFSL